MLNISFMNEYRSFSVPSMEIQESFFIFISHKLIPIYELGLIKHEIDKEFR
ncbi:MAG: hypothetical protein K0R71_1387 [Bacillales bacterium]|jgi:hypothetical protein|nr:hypothetical protein [Bacillales bacterium]